MPDFEQRRAAVEQAIAQRSRPTTAASAAPDVIGQIEQIGRLRDAGERGVPGKEGRAARRTLMPGWPEPPERRTTLRAGSCSTRGAAPSVGRAPLFPPFTSGEESGVAVARVARMED